MHTGAQCTRVRREHWNKEKPNQAFYNTEFSERKRVVKQSAHMLLIRSPMQQQQQQQLGKQRQCAHIHINFTK